MELFNENEHPLAPLCDQWLAKIDDAIKVRDAEFGQYAKEAEDFFDGAHDFMWKQEYAKQDGGFLDPQFSDSGFPRFRMTVNRVFEAQALYGPALYHKNPNILVSQQEDIELGPEVFGVNPQDQQGMQWFQGIAAQQQSERNARDTEASVMQRLLNVIQYSGKKKDFARKVIGEAIVTGLGLFITELFQPKGSDIRYPRSTYLHWRDFVCDPDAENWEDVQWIAIRCVHPVNKVEEEYPLEKGDLKGQMMSRESQGNTYGSLREKSEREKKSKSFDLIEYWKVYSKNGMGDRLKSSEDTLKSKFNFEALGDHRYIVVSRGIPFPLNLHSRIVREAVESQRMMTEMAVPDAMAIEKSQAAVQRLFEQTDWPIPFWQHEESDGGWPITRLFFYEKGKCVWPVSLVKPVIGWLRFINWCMSFLADRVSAGSQTILAIAKRASDSIKKSLAENSGPFRIAEIEAALENNGKLSQLIEFIQAPNVTTDIWQIVAEAMEFVDKGMGLTELAYGLSGRQLRSAQESADKMSQISIRPDDMSSKTEDCVSCVVIKEIQVGWYFLEGKDVAPLVGQVGAQIWDNRIRAMSLDQITRGFTFRIEAGSARKPNKQARVAQMNEFGQMAGALLQGLVQQGQVGPWNAFATDWCKAMDIDPTPYLIPPPPPQEGPSPEEQQFQMEMQKLQMEMQASQMEAMTKIKLQEQQLQIKQAELALRAAESRQSMQFDQQRHLMELVQDGQRSNQELVQDEQMHELDIRQQREMGVAKIAIAKAQARAKPAANGSRK